MYKRWTKEETTVLVEAVKECPTLKAACLVASTKTGRTVTACQAYWYDYCKKQKTLVSEEKPKSMWEKIINCFKFFN